MLIVASFMKMISPYLDSYACMNAISESDMDEQKSKDRLIELLLDDLIFFAALNFIHRQSLRF